MTDGREPMRDAGTTPRPRRGETGASPRRRRASQGRRAQQLRARRRRARTRTSLALTLLVGLVVVVVAVASGVVDRARDLVTGDPEPEQVVDQPGGAQPTLAVVTVERRGGEPHASSIVLLAYDREAEQGTVLLVPTETLTDVPGHGAFRIGEAYRFGEGPLVAVTLDNLLGIRLDAVATVSRAGWTELFELVGGYEVEVPRPLVAAPDEGGQQRFVAGPQFLEPARLAELLTFEVEGESELEALPRVQRVVLGLLQRLADDPPLADALAEAPALELSVDDPELVRSLLTELAAARTDDRVTTLTLPVSPIGTGGDDAYRPDTSRVAQLVDDRLAASRPDDRIAGGRSLRILNGNGRPGVGAVVAERLQPGGYRVLLTGNADRFTYETTRIIVHDDEDTTLAAAQDIRQRLGVGDIERSGTPQSVVDITIVVGHDLLERDD